MSATQGTRLTLARHINELWYEGSAWLKAVPLSDLGEALKPAERHLLDAYREASDPHLDQQRAVIRLFLGEWLMYRLPEHIGTWGLAADAFQHVPVDAAVALADEILRACVEEKPVEIAPGEYQDWAPRILERMPWYAKGDEPPPGVECDDPGDVRTVPYPRLRDWFPGELFDPASAAFFAYRRSIEPTPIRFHHTWPHVIGMDRQLIGMMWLESG